MNDAPLLIERRDAIAIVTLNRPHCLNALNEELAKALTSTARILADDKTVRSIVLTGKGRAFCAGADLAPGALPLNGPTRGAATRAVLEQLFNPIVTAWVDLPQPVVVAQNGIAAGGGIGLALTGDFLLMTEAACWTQVFVPKLGLIPDMGVTALLPHAIGSARAQSLAMTGAAFTARQAEAAGVVHEVTGEEDLLPRAIALAEKLALGPRSALALTKTLFKIDREALSAALAREALLQESLANLAEHQEGITAFLEKRLPQFP